MLRPHQTAIQEKLWGTSDGTDEEAYTTYLEDRLSRILSQIEGTGEVKVMITLKSSAEKVLDKDTESDQETVTEEDSQGGTRQSSKTSKKKIRYMQVTVTALLRVADFHM